MVVVGRGLGGGVDFGYWRAGYFWTAAAAIAIAAIPTDADIGATGTALFWVIFLTLAVVLNVASIRRGVITQPVFRWFRGALPQVSQTEQEALDAGTVWWDGDLFRGRPDWHKLLSIPKPELTADEKAFLDGPVDELCAMLDDWKITHQLYYLPPEVWKFIKDRGFLGMIIPKQYGGLGFSALAHSEVVMKLTTAAGLPPFR
jgi:acyl-CoA dehydrogenase